MNDNLSASAPGAAALSRAGLWRRLAALLYDGFLVVAIWFVLGYIMQFIFGPESNQLVDGQVQTDPLASEILFVLMLGSAFAFYFWFWTQSGQTLGMIAWRIRVESNSGGLLNPRQALLRFILAWPAFFLFGIGFLWLLVDSAGDALHDKWSHTHVVLLPKSHQPFK